MAIIDDNASEAVNESDLGMLQTDQDISGHVIRSYFVFEDGNLLLNLPAKRHKLYEVTSVSKETTNASF